MAVQLDRYRSGCAKSSSGVPLIAKIINTIFGQCKAKHTIFVFIIFDNSPYGRLYGRHCKATFEKEEASKQSKTYFFHLSLSLQHLT